MLVKAVGNTELVNNQWKYKYMSNNISVDIPLPWDIIIPCYTRNFKVDFGISIDTRDIFIILPKETLGNLRISYSPYLVTPGITRIIISIDNTSIFPIKLYTSHHYITLVSLINQGIVWDYHN